MEAVHGEQGSLAEFSRYLELPPEVRKHILEYLTAAKEKLCVGTGIPQEADLMSWNIPKLLFSLVDYDELVTLSVASAIIRNYVPTNLEDYIGASFSNKLRKISVRTAVVPPPENIGNGTRPNPIPAQVCLEFSSAQHGGNVDQSLDEFRFLTDFGRYIRDCKITLTKCLDRSTIEVIQRCFTLMPNLKRARVNVRDRCSEGGDQFMDDVVLPALPQLELLWLDGNYCDWRCMKLVESYGPFVKGLRLEPISLIVPFYHNFRKLWYPKLTTLESTESFSESRRRPMELKRILSCVDKLAEGKAPLKVIRFKGNNRVYEPTKLMELMIVFHRFGETLEELEMKLVTSPTAYQPSSNYVMYRMDHFWELGFPNVKTLRVEYCPVTWKMLPKFPALERLFFDGKNISSPPNFKADPTSNFSWSVDENKIRRWSIWKILSDLEEIKFYRWNSGKEEILEVNRVECVVPAN